MKSTGKSAGAGANDEDVRFELFAFYRHTPTLPEPPGWAARPICEA